MPAILGPDPSSVGSPLSVVPQTVVAQQKMARSDRLEVSDVLKLSEHATSSRSCDSASTKEEGVKCKHHQQTRVAYREGGG